jgi:hypothetical protein
MVLCRHFFSMSLSLVLFSATVTPTFSQISDGCTAANLSNLLNNDLADYDKKNLQISLANRLKGANINAFYVNGTLKAITSVFMGVGGKADMNFYFIDKESYLMEYIGEQNSNYYDEADSVLLTKEISYYHVCDQALLAPAFGGIINDDIYQNMKVMLDIILIEEASQ